MKNKIYKYTVMSRQFQWRIAAYGQFMGEVSIIHRRTNWRWLARLWACWYQAKTSNHVKVLVIDGHVETEFKDNQP
jgi:hypothetical protein